MQVGRYTLQDIPALKLLHYAKKDELLQEISPERARQIEQHAKEEGQKFTAKYLKEELARDDEFMERFRGSMLGNYSMERYGTKYERMTDPDVVAKSRAVRSALAEPRRGFLGCVATKLNPSDIKSCTKNYDLPEYKGIQLVPSSGLKQSVFESTHNAILETQGHISYLPKGLKKYILERPDEYAAYIRERRAEIEFLKAVKKNAKNEQREAAAPPVEQQKRKRV